MKGNRRTAQKAVQGKRGNLHGKQARYQCLNTAVDKTPKNKLWKFRITKSDFRITFLVSTCSSAIPPIHSIWIGCIMRLHLEIGLHCLIYLCSFAQTNWKVSLYVTKQVPCDGLYKKCQVKLMWLFLKFSFSQKIMHITPQFIFS